MQRLNLADGAVVLDDEVEGVVLILLARESYWRYVENAFWQLLRSLLLS